MILKLIINKSDDFSYVFNKKCTFFFVAYDFSYVNKVFEKTLKKIDLQSNHCITKKIKFT